MFTKILIANRGEIAVRIIRACKEMGIATVAVYSTADKDALHVALADESVCIGEASPKESYLCIDRIVSAALIKGATAIHPGYGFLSENEKLALECEKNGIAFIGPSAHTMEKLSDKAQIKAMMKDAGLPVIPGAEEVENLEEAVRVASTLGYPVMLKARLGGGGRGIRVIPDESELRRVFATATAESEAAFGDGSLYMEKYIYPARHIEVQIMADEFGNVLCLGERDCSIQRRYQKLIEETTSPAISKESREVLTDKVIKAVKAIGYVGAGTLEFLLDSNGDFHFMEMNLRLQVEHGITEMLTGFDLVKWQIRVAAGVELKVKQEEIDLSGCCIECRINAKSTGKVSVLHIPGGPFVRFDTFLVQDTVISPYYDSLLGKLIVYASTREEAVRKMTATLCELVIEGVDTNIEEQLSLVGAREFIDGSYDLRFMEGR